MLTQQEAVLLVSLQSNRCFLLLVVATVHFVLIPLLELPAEPHMQRADLPKLVCEMGR